MNTCQTGRKNKQITYQHHDEKQTGAYFLEETTYKLHCGILRLGRWTQSQIQP